MDRPQSQEAAVPLYLFHIRTATREFRDSEGVDLPDIRAAHEHALAGARDMMRRDRTGSEDWSSWTFEIMDQFGRYALTVPFSEAGRGGLRSG